MDWFSCRVVRRYYNARKTWFRVSLEESRVGVFVFDWRRNEFESVGDKHLGSARGVCAQLARGHVKRSAEFEDLFAGGDALLLGQAVLDAGRRSHSIAGPPCQAAPHEVLPKHVDVDVDRRGVQVGFGQHVAAKQQVVSTQGVVVAPHEVVVAGGHDVQRLQLHLGQVRHGQTGVVLVAFPHEDAEIHVRGRATAISGGNGGVVGDAVDGNPVGVEALAEQRHVQAHADVCAIGEGGKVIRIAQLHHGVGLLSNFILVELETQRAGNKIHIGVGVDHGGHGRPVDTHPLVAVPRIHVGEVVLTSCTNVECRKVVEPLRHLGVLLAQGRCHSEARKCETDGDVANHLIPLIFSRLHL